MYVHEERAYTYVCLCLYGGWLPMVTFNSDKFKANYNDTLATTHRQASGEETPDAQKCVRASNRRRE